MSPSSNRRTAQFFGLGELEGKLSRLSRERTVIKRTAATAVAIIAFIGFGQWYLTPRSTGIHIDALRNSSHLTSVAYETAKKANNIRYQSRSPASTIEAAAGLKPVENLNVNQLSPTGTEITGK